ncbi:hypothetical protein ACP4J4_04770 [Aureimonas ureilytica]|uniref:hypothetical protein n=1 Tax=Aureimonas ureilytica TaxID=401562 RepID=UPI003CEC309A
MAENKGFFRRLFSFGAKEEDRTQHEGGIARTQDTTAARSDASAPEIHQPAAASTDTDTEAGASVQTPDEGGIIPLKSGEDANGVAAEKKTP